MANVRRFRHFVSHGPSWHQAAAYETFIKKSYWGLAVGGKARDQLNAL
jgi:hypothetical protein